MISRALDTNETSLIQNVMAGWSPHPPWAVYGKSDYSFIPRWKLPIVAMKISIVSIPLHELLRPVGLWEIYLIPLIWDPYL